MKSIKAPLFPLARWQSIVLTILIAQGITVGAYAFTTPVLAFILKDLFGLEGEELVRWNGWMFVAAGATMALLSPVWGVLADKMGKRLMLVRAMLGGMVVLFLMTFVQSPMQLLILRLLQGAFTGSIAAATVLILFFTPKEKSATALALLQVSIYMGGSLGPLVGGALYDYLLRFDQLNQTQLSGRANFLFTAILLAISSFLILRFVPKDRVERRPKDPASTQTSKFQLTLFKENPLLLVLLLAGMIVSIAFALVTPIFPLFIKSIVPDTLDLGTISGVIIGSASITLALGAIFFAKMGKRFAMNHLLLVALTGAALFYIPQVYATSWQMLLIFRLIASFFVGGITPGLNYLISSNAPSHKHGIVFGLVASLNAVGSALGPALGVWVVSDNQFYSAFIMSAGLLMALVIILMLSPKIIAPKSSTPTEIPNNES